MFCEDGQDYANKYHVRSASIYGSAVLRISLRFVLAFNYSTSANVTQTEQVKNTHRTAVDLPYRHRSAHEYDVRRVRRWVCPSALR